MSFWDHLFDSEFHQREDINALRVDAGISHELARNHARGLALADRRIARLELMVEALFRHLEARGQLTREQFAVMIARVDLADGREDGMMGPDRSRAAPACGRCGKPVNPARARCLFCEAPVERAADEARPPPVTLVACRSCQAKVPERDVYFAEIGMVCEPCFHNLEG